MDVGISSGLIVEMERSKDGIIESDDSSWLKLLRMIVCFVFGL